MKFKIKPQHYPTASGERPLSYAIYRGRTFLGYSWSQEGAETALREIRRSSLQAEDDRKITTVESLDALCRHKQEKDLVEVLK